MSDSTYEIKRKLLEIQNELLKGAVEKDVPLSNPPPQHTDAPAAPEQPEDMLSLLKELRANQYKMMHTLAEINHKLSRGVRE